jgi:hypothetical protein
MIPVSSSSQRRKRRMALVLKLGGLFCGASQQKAKRNAAI